MHYKILKYRELPDDIFIIVADWIECLIAEGEVDDDLIFEVVSILGKTEQQLNWKHFIKNDS